MKTSSHFALVLNIWMAATCIIFAHFNPEAAIVASLFGTLYAGLLMLRYAGQKD